MFFYLHNRATTFQQLIAYTATRSIAFLATTTKSSSFRIRDVTTNAATTNPCGPTVYASSLADHQVSSIATPLARRAANVARNMFMIQKRSNAFYLISANPMTTTCSIDEVDEQRLGDFTHRFVVKFCELFAKLLFYSHTIKLEVAHNKELLNVRHLSCSLTLLSISLAILVIWGTKSELVLLLSVLPEAASPTKAQRYLYNRVNNHENC